MTNQMSDDLEAQADALLKAHPQDTSYPAYSERVLGWRDRHRKETSLESMCESRGIKIPVPPAGIRKIINRAMNAACSVNLAHAWTLHELGWSSSKIAEALGISERAASWRVQRARQAIKKHIDKNSDVLLVYYWETNGRRLYFDSKPQDVLPSALSRAREVIEDNGYDTFIMPRNPNYVIVTHHNGESLRLTYSRTIAMAREIQQN